MDMMGLNRKRGDGTWRTWMQWRERMKHMKRRKAAVGTWLVEGVLCIALSLLILILACPAWAADYYVDCDAAAGGDGSVATPWDAVADVNGASFSAGDTINFKRGCVFREQLVVSTSGSSGLPITYGAYGTATDPKPILTAGEDLSNTELWTEESANLWYAAEAAGARSRIIASNNATPLIRVANKTDCDTQGEMWRDTENKRSYVYSVGNPATYYAGGTYPLEGAKYLYLIDASTRGHLTFDSLDLRNGRIGIQAGGNNITVTNCDLWNMYDYGIYIAKYLVATSGHTITGTAIYNTGGHAARSDNPTYGNPIRLRDCSTVEIANNTIVTGPYGSTGIQAVLQYGTDNTGLNIHDNYLSGGDAGINLYHTATGAIISNNTIVDVGTNSYLGSDSIAINGVNSVVTGNTCTQNAATAYLDGVWGVETIGGANTCNGSVISGNTFNGSRMLSALGGGGSTITFTQNTVQSVDGVRSENCDESIFSSNSIIVTGSGTSYAGIYVKSTAAGTRNVNVYNNTILGAGGGAGIWFVEGSGTWNVATKVKNNIITGFSKGIVCDDKDDNGVDVVHTNNSYYNNTANLQKKVATVYSNIDLDGTEITADPKLTSTTNFRLLPNSPAINAGVNVCTAEGVQFATCTGDGTGTWTDIKGSVVPHNGKISIGAYQFTSFDTEQGESAARKSWRRVFRKF